MTVPEAGLTLVMTIQRNLDTTLPASHTVSLAFSQTGSSGTARTVQDVGLLQAKDEQSARGSPVSGLPVRVRDNLFLIGLSSLQNDVERNTDLLLHRNWFDIALRYTSGRRAVLTFEKGTAGARSCRAPSTPGSDERDRSRRSVTPGTCCQRASMPVRGSSRLAMLRLTASCTFSKARTSI